MKLLDRYNRISLVMTVVVMMITGMVYYYTISKILTSQIDKDLDVEETEIFEYVKLNNSLPQVFKSEDQQITFFDIGAANIKRAYIDTVFFNSREKEHESGRGLNSSVKVQGKTYRITVVESKVETEDLIRIIFLITLGLIILIILILFIINRLAIKKLWQPFYRTLHQIKLFNVADKTTITYEQSEIDEFQQLNDSVNEMALRATNDYQELKTFMENASHELMTPIAVINSKLDTLIQTDEFTERQAELLSDVYETISRLTRLNKAMLLLTKIENKLITDDQIFDAKICVDEALGMFQELLADKVITVSTGLESVSLNMSKTLFEVLLNNLLGNAIRHNHNNGRVAITLNSSVLMIANTGKPEALDANQIFNRFRKSAESEGSGLGLTLSKQICENYQFKFDYKFDGSFHIFTVTFNL